MRRQNLWLYEKGRMRGRKGHEEDARQEEERKEKMGEDIIQHLII